MRCGILFAAVCLLLAGCGQPGAQSGETTEAPKPVAKFPEIELLQPEDEQALRIASACRFFKSEHWAKPLVLISSKELAFKRDGKFVHLRLDSTVKPNSANQGQMFYRGEGYSARTMGLVDKSSKSFGLNIQADNEDRVVIGHYGFLSCPDKP